MKGKQGEYEDEGLNNSHIVIFDIHSEYKTAFPQARFIDITNLKLPYWLLNVIACHHEQFVNECLDGLTGILLRLIIRNIG